MFAWKNMDDRYSLLMKLKMEMVYRDLQPEIASQQFMEITQPVLPVTEVKEPSKEPSKEPPKEPVKEKPKPKKKVIKAALPKSTK
jgi:hypothetical protein